MSIATTLSLKPQANNNTDFRALFANVSAQILSAGMVKAADTGQIDFTSVISPNNASQVAGYEIWHFNDAFQASSPVYWKIEYGSGSQNTYPACWITLGTGSTGNGFVTGVTSNRWVNPNSKTIGIAMGANSANSYNCYFSGDPSRFNCWLMQTAVNSTVGLGSTHNMGFAMERTKDANGNDTGEGILFTSFGTGFNQYLWDTRIGQLNIGSTTSGQAQNLNLLMPTVGNGVNGANTSVYPVFHSRGGSFANPGLNILGYFCGTNSSTGDIAPGTTTTISMYGVNHTYMAGGFNWQASGGNCPSYRNGQVGLLYRYE
jgi:hypothetical protein